MSKPYTHAVSSARKFGGVPEDYMKLHNLMDSSKGTIADSRHRALTHNAWFIGPDGPLELIFGVNIVNSEGRKVSVRELGEQHILEDFGMRFIPSAQDYLQEINMKEWMLSGKGTPPSHALVVEQAKEKTQEAKRERKKPQLEVPTEIDNAFAENLDDVFMDGATTYRKNSNFLD